MKRSYFFLKLCLKANRDLIGLNRAEIFEKMLGGCSAILLQKLILEVLNRFTIRFVCIFFYIGIRIAKVT